MKRIPRLRKMRNRHHQDGGKPYLRLLKTEYQHPWVGLRDGQEGVRFGKSCRERYSHGEMASENGCSSYKTTIMSQTSDGENQEELSRELRIGERDGKLYSRTVEGLDGGRLMAPRPTCYDCPVEKTNQKPRNQRRDRLGN
jgi:hypothetical protein